MAFAQHSGFCSFSYVLVQSGGLARAGITTRLWAIPVHPPRVAGTSSFVSLTRLTPGVHSRDCAPCARIAVVRPSARVGSREIPECEHDESRTAHGAHTDLLAGWKLRTDDPALPFRTRPRHRRGHRCRAARRSMRT